MGWELLFPNGEIVVETGPSEIQSTEPPRLTDEVRSMLKRSSDSELVGAVLALFDMFDEYDQAAARMIKGLGAEL